MPDGEIGEGVAIERIGLHERVMHLVGEHETVVFYMGLVGLREICSQLIAHGRAGDTPIALVSRGTTNLQEVITGTLNQLPDDIEGREIHAPTLIIVGSVVSLHPKFSWFKP